MGLFPMAPGDGIYQLTTPLFDRVEILHHPGLAAGESFEIQSGGREAGVAIQSASLNGESLEEPRIHHARLLEGGTLDLELGSTP